MKISSIVAFARSRAGSVVAACVGLTAVLLLLRHAGPHAVWLAITRSAAVVPIVLICEGCAITLEACSLRTLYGKDKHRLPISELVRSTMIGYAVAGLMPAGRPVAEGVRGTTLARWTSGPRAVAAGAKQQSILLLVQAAISIPCLIATIVLHAAPIVTWAMAINGAMTFVIGGGVLFSARHPRVAKWIGKLSSEGGEFVPALHAMLRDEPIPLAAYGYAFAARVIQSLQYTFLLVGLGHGFSLARGLCAEGVHLVGATIGDLIPSHVGATEANFQVAANTLGLSLSDALAIPLVVHSVQLILIAVGTLVMLLWQPLDPNSVTATTTEAKAP